MAGTACDAEHLAVDDDGALRWYEPAEGVFYGFCGSCGSTLFWRNAANPDHITVTAGSLDQPTGLQTVAAWYVAEHGDYHERAEVPVSHDTEPG